jgi:hypothetical protein
MAQLQQLQPSRLSCSINRHHRTFCSALKPVTRCRPVAAAQQHQAAADQIVTPVSQIPQWLHFTPAAVLASTLTAAGSAYADEAVDAAYAAAVEGGPTDLVVTAMATFVFALLVVVTGGVSAGFVVKLGFDQNGVCVNTGFWLE